MNRQYTFPVYDLTPTDTADNVECYSYMLKEALKRKNVTNIAIAGRYGSGKSSFLNTFFKAYKNEEVLRISMAAFLEKDGGEGLDEPEERLLEISILQQMFYHVTQGALPFSRFRRLTRFERGTWGLFLVYVVLLVASLICVVQPHSMTQHLSSYFVCKWTNMAYWCGVSLCAVMSSIGLVQLLRFYKKIKHCNLNFQNIELAIKKEDETSVFNRYMDEVVYFFEETGYTTVLFEDIDRFRDTRIFTKLRELNLILNRAKQITKKPIRFIYALRDNVFTGTERVKFFDFILPIVPVVDSKSSAAKLKEMLSDYLGEEQVAEYDEMVHALSPYISDMRLMNNILNEFAAYREMISTQGNGTQFLGMMIFKNFFPAEFAKLYERTDSLLAWILSRKKEIANEKKLELELEVGKVKADVAASEREKLKSIEELRTLYMVRCVGDELPSGAKSIEWKGQDAISMSEFFSTPALFDSLYGKNFQVTYIVKNNYYNNYCEMRSVGFEWKSIYPQVKKVLGEYKERVKAIEGKTTVEQEKYSCRIAELETEKDVISRLTLSDMLKKGWFGEDDIRNALEDCYPKSDDDGEVDIKRETILLLYQLLYGGYVGENYEHFISMFKEGDTTRGDNDFETAVLENVEHQFDHSLDDPLAVANHLGVGMFLKPAIRNLALIEAMIRERERYKDKLEAFASCFVRNSSGNQRFAIELMLRTSSDAEVAIKVIEFYVEHWPDCIDDLFKGGNLTEDSKTKLVETCLRWLKSSHGVVPSEVGAYISKARHPCEVFKNAGYDPEKMVELLGAANVRLVNCVFETEEEKSYVDAVRHAGCYLYRDGMLERLMAASGVDIADFSLAPMSCVRKSGLEDVIDDVNENFDYFVETFYTVGEKEDSPEMVIEVLNTADFDAEDREKFAKVQRQQIADLALIKDDELAKRLLMVNAVAVSWANVVHAAERFVYNADAQGFLGKNRNELSNQGWQSVEKPLQKWVDRLICAETVAVDELRSTLELFPTPIKIQTLTKIDIPAERIHVAVECGRVGFTPELYEQLKKAGKGGHMELAEAYPSEFIQACKTNSWEMLCKDLARIFTSERFSDGQKCDVAQMYESGVSDTSVAKAVAAFLTKRNYKKMSEIVLEGVFPYLAQSDLQALILQRLNPASEKVKEMIPKMKTPYNAIFDDKCRAQLPSTALNKSFVQFLIGKGLIAVKTTLGDNGNAKEK